MHRATLLCCVVYITAVCMWQKRGGAWREAGEEGAAQRCAQAQRAAAEARRAQAAAEAAAQESARCAPRVARACVHTRHPPLAGLGLWWQEGVLAIAGTG